MKYSSSVNNYRETPYIVSDTFANKVNYAATIKGAIYVARDGASLNEPSIYQANGTIWVPIGGYGIGTDATLQDVTTNGKTTNQGITITAGGLSTNRITDTELTAKSIPFVGTAGLITQDNTNLVWDNVNKWIGIQTNVPTAEVDIHTTTATPAIVINNTSALASRIGFQNTNVNKWTIGNSATNTFNFYNSVLASIAAYFDGANNAITFNGSVQALSAGGSRDTTVRYNGSIVDPTATIPAVAAVAKFSNNGSGNITKIILSDIVNADCTLSFQPKTTIADSIFGIGINSNPLFVVRANGNIGINTQLPNYKLEVIGPGAFSGSSTSEILLLNTAGVGNRNWRMVTNNSGAGNITLDQSTTDQGGTYATKFVITTNGEVQISTSNAGLQFNNSSATTNSILNDYETGTFTPTITAETGTYTTVTNQRGNYTKVGKMVTIQLYFIVSNKGTGSTGVIIGNLPFAAKSSSAGDKYSGVGFDSSSGILAQILLDQGSTSAIGYNYLGLDPIVVSHGNNFTLTYQANF